MDDTNKNNNNNTEEQLLVPPNWRDTWTQCVTPANLSKFIRLARQLLRNDPDCEELGRLRIHGRLDANNHRLFDLALYGQLLDVLGTKLTRVELYFFNTTTTTRRENPSSVLHFILETLCLPKFPNLQGLVIINCNLDGLAASKLGDLLCAGGLHWLNIDFCNLTLDFLQQWKQAVLACPQTKCRFSKLYLDHWVIQDGQRVVEMLEIVKLFPHLEVLCLSPRGGSIRMTDHQFWSVAICIDALPRLKELVIGNIFSNVANESIKVFFRGLSKKQDLERLELHEMLAAGPTQDLLVETVASLPALKEFHLQAEIDSPAKFLSSLLERLIQRQSKLTSLSVCSTRRATYMDECWFQWIPHLGPHFRNIRIQFDEYVGRDHPQWPNFISSMRKNGYLSNISIGTEPPANLSQICRRNKLLAQVKEKGCLSPAETTMHQQQWAFLLEGMANRRNILDSSPLFSFVRYNVTNITNAVDRARNKRKMKGYFKQLKEEK